MTADRTRSTAAKKTSARKATPRKTATRKKTTDTSSGGGATPTKKRATRATADGRSAREAPRAESAPRPGAVELAGRAAAQLTELTGRTTEGVTRLERSEDGWTVELEVLELRRIPETTDVLATYEATLDERGQLQGYQRTHRYVRGAGQERS